MGSHIHPASRFHRFSFQPRLERLEDRSLLCSFTGMDDGQGIDANDIRPVGLPEVAVVEAGARLHAAPHQGHEHAVPLVGVFSGQTVSAAPTGDPNVIFVVTEGTGHASHLGRFTMSSPHYSHLDTLLAEGTQVFTAANGDKLEAEFTGQFKPTADGELHGILHATIVGGSGRFADASGNYDFDILFDPATFQSTAKINGTIDF